MIPGRNPLPFDTQVRLYVTHHFVNSGVAPSAADAATALACSEEEVRAAWGRLADAHMIVLQEGGGDLLMVNPFSAVPTPFSVQVGDRSWYANCIWDALGILAMLGHDGRVETSCPCCGEALALTVRGGKLIEGEGVIHFAVPAKQWWDDIVFT